MSFTIFFSHTNLEPILLEVQVLSLLHPDVLLDVCYGEDPFAAMVAVYFQGT